MSVLTITNPYVVCPYPFKVLVKVKSPGGREKSWWGMCIEIEYRGCPPADMYNIMPHIGGKCATHLF